jgi:hypothetical protein
VCATADPLRVGWRERDYAKFRKDEFNAIYGQRGPNEPYGTATMPAARSRRRRRSRRTGVPRGLRLIILAVAAAGALFGGAVATGRVEDINSLFQRTLSPAPAVVIPAPAPVQVQMPVATRTTRITGTRLLQYGSTFRLSGSHSPMAGTIVISGRWGAGRWETFAVARAASRSFAFQVPLTRRGILHLRIAYPDGERAVGTYQVR